MILRHFSTFYDLIIFKIKINLKIAKKYINFSKMCNIIWILS